MVRSQTSQRSGPSLLRLRSVSSMLPSTTSTNLFWFIFLLAYCSNASGDGCLFSPTRQHDTFELPDRMATHTTIAADLSDLSYIKSTYPDIQNGNDFGYERLQVWRDYDDLAILAKEDGACYAAFRGTTCNPSDIVQLWDANEKWVGGCKVRAGFHNAYYAKYFHEFRAAVGECMASASELVVTGQSQGGSNAIVAFVDLQEFDPIAITFGAIRTLVQPCDSIDTSRHYRFVNVGNGAYDEWTNRFSKSAMHMGHSLLLDATAVAPAAYLGLDDDTSRSPRTRVVHEPSLYWAGVLSMVETACHPIRISGWEDGHWCTDGIECDSGSCVNSICTGRALAPGEQCSTDYDCESGQCTKNSKWWVKPTCA